VFFVFVNVNIVNSHLIVVYLTTCLHEDQQIKNAIGRQKKKINCFWAKKRFFPVHLLSPDSIQEGEEENISVVAQGIPLRIGYVERIAPGLTNR
jgi:hypothetical protein